MEDLVKLACIEDGITICPDSDRATRSKNALYLQEEDVRV